MRAEDRNGAGAGAIRALAGATASANCFAAGARSSAAKPPERLDTHLERDDLTAEQPSLFRRSGVEGPYYVEPVVLAGSLS
jgi:hypothetical protein